MAYRGRWSVVGLMVLLVAAKVADLHGADEKSESQSPSKSKRSGSIDPQAEKILRQMADSISAAKTYRKDFTATARVIRKGPGGAKANFTFGVASEQPNRVSIVAKGSRDAVGLVCNGQELFVQVPAVKKFMVDKAPASFAEILASPELNGAKAQHILLLSAMLDLLPAEQLLAKLDSAKYLDEAKVGPAKCHHLELTIEPYTLEVWIDQGDKPRIRKIVPNMDKWVEANSQELGEGAKLEMTLAFKNWALDPRLTAATFKFAPSEDLTQVPSFAPQAGSKADPLVLLDKLAPMFQLSMLSGGGMNLTSHKNKEVVILDFWATWCGPCVKGLPIVSEVAASYKSKGVAFYAINLRETPDDVTPFLQQKSLSIPVALDSDGSVAKLYMVDSIPRTVLIGKDGTVQAMHLGLSEDLKEELSRQLDTLLAGKSLVKK